MQLINIETSASGKPPVFGTGIPQVRILPSQLDVRQVIYLLGVIF